MNKPIAKYIGFIPPFEEVLKTKLHLFNLLIPLNNPKQGIIHPVNSTVTFATIKDCAANLVLKEKDIELLERAMRYFNYYENKNSIRNS